MIPLIIPSPWYSLRISSLHVQSLISPYLVISFVYTNHWTSIVFTNMFDPLDKLYDPVIIDVLTSTFINVYSRILILQSILSPRIHTHTTILLFCMISNIWLTKAIWLCKYRLLSNNLLILNLSCNAVYKEILLSLFYNSSI